MLGGGLDETQQSILKTLNEGISETERGIAALEEQFALLQGINELDQERLNTQIQLAELAERYPSQFQAVSDVLAIVQDRFNILSRAVTAGIQGFADTIASSIADAFDPTTDASIRERFGQFLKQLGQQIIAELTRVAIAAILLNVASGGILGSVFGSLGGIATGTPGAFGRAEGGRIGKHEKKYARPSAAHMGAKGFAGGGRPAGLHPSDTIPIWVAENEWVIKARSAMKAASLGKRQSVTTSPAGADGKSRSSLRGPFFWSIQC